MIDGNWGMCHVGDGGNIYNDNALVCSYVLNSDVDEEYTRGNGNVYDYVGDDSTVCLCYESKHILPASSTIYSSNQQPNMCVI